MKAKLRRLLLGATFWVVLLVPALVLALSSADTLMQFGMPDSLANYISTKLVAVNSSGNLVLPVATGKSLLVQFAGVTKLSESATAASLTGTLAVSGTSTLATTSVTGLQIPTANEEAVAGAGTTVADAAAFSATKHLHQTTGANGTVGWKFTTSVAGQVEFLMNTTAGVPKIYAASGGTCNGGATDAACTLVTGIVSHICYSTAADTWICA